MPAQLWSAARHARRGQRADARALRRAPPPAPARRALLPPAARTRCSPCSSAPPPWRVLGLEALGVQTVGEVPDALPHLQPARPLAGCGRLHDRPRPRDHGRRVLRQRAHGPRLRRASRPADRRQPGVPRARRRQRRGRAAVRLPGEQQRQPHRHRRLDGQPHPAVLARHPRDASSCRSLALGPVIAAFPRGGAGRPRRLRRHPARRRRRRSAGSRRFRRSELVLLVATTLGVFLARRPLRHPARRRPVARRPAAARRAAARRHPRLRAAAWRGCTTSTTSRRPRRCRVSSSTATTHRCSSPTPRTSTTAPSPPSTRPQRPSSGSSINAEANVEVDLTSLDALDQLRRDLEVRGIVLALARVEAGPPRRPRRGRPRRRHRHRPDVRHAADRRHGLPRVVRGAARRTAPLRAGAAADPPPPQRQGLDRRRSTHVGRAAGGVARLRTRYRYVVDRRQSVVSTWLRGRS